MATRFIGDTETIKSIQSAIGLPAAQFGVSAESADNTTALSDAIAAAFTQGRTLVLPTGTIKYSSPLTFPNAAGTLRIVGQGRPRSLTGGNAGDPIAPTGTELKYNGATGDAFGWTLTGINKRVYLTLENFAIYGNKASGTSGHGIHLKSAESSSAIIPDLRNITVMDCKEHNIFIDGNVFEGVLDNVRSTGAGGAGLIARKNLDGIPGEFSIQRGSFVSNEGNGIDLDGGSTWSLEMVTATANVGLGFKAVGITLRIDVLHMEVNGGAVGNQCVIQCQAPVMRGLFVSPVGGATGVAIDTTGSVAPKIDGLFAGGHNLGAGYLDLKLADRGELNSYLTTDFNDRVQMVGENHIYRLGNVWKTGQIHARQVIDAPDRNVGYQPDARIADSFFFNLTAAFLTVANPLSKNGTGGHNGQRITVTIHNNTTGPLEGINWGALFEVRSFPLPAAGKAVAVAFEWHSAIAKWVQTGASTAPIQGAINDPAHAVAAPTQAEFNALVDQVRGMLAVMRTHRLIAT